ncbi:MAG: hypothetical protein QOI01_4531, partial [Mycobacterium sp.]|nr:hypothetical protein [Mycobacterium sp.]
HDAVVTADLDDECILTARARFDDLPSDILEMLPDHQGTGSTVGIICAIHLIWWNLVDLLHHGARPTESNGKPEERHQVALVQFDECVRHGLASEVENLANDTAANTASVVSQRSPLSRMFGGSKFASGGCRLTGEPKTLVQVVEAFR